MDLDELADAMNVANRNFGFGYRLVRASELYHERWRLDAADPVDTIRKSEIGKIALARKLDDVLEIARREEPERFKGLETSEKSAVVYLDCGNNVNYADVLARVFSRINPHLKVLGIAADKNTIDMFNLLTSSAGINVTGAYGQIEDLDGLLKKGDFDSAGIIALFNPFTNRTFPKLEGIKNPDCIKNAILIGSAEGREDSDEHYRKGLEDNGFRTVAEMPNELRVYIGAINIGVHYYCDPLFVAAKRGD